MVTQKTRAVLTLLGLACVSALVSRSGCYRDYEAAVKENRRFLQDCVNSGRPCPGVAQADLLARLRRHGVPLETTGRDGQKDDGGDLWTLWTGLQAPDGTRIQMETRAQRSEGGASARGNSSRFERIEVARFGLLRHSETLPPATTQEP